MSAADTPVAKPKPKVCIDSDTDSDEESAVFAAQRQGAVSPVRSASQFSAVSDMPFMAMSLMYGDNPEESDDDEGDVELDEEEREQVEKQSKVVGGDGRFSAIEERTIKREDAVRMATLSQGDRQRLSSLSGQMPSMRVRIDSQKAVEFRRIALDGFDPSELETADIGVLLAIMVRAREKYMKRSCQEYPKFISDVMRTPKTFVKTRFNKTKVHAATKPSRRFASEDAAEAAIKAGTVQFEMKDGVFNVYSTADEEKVEPFFKHIEVGVYLRDLHFLTTIVNDGPTKSFCFRRLQFLLNKFKMHSMLNETAEYAQQRMEPHRDFYNVRKVDTHVHLSASMNQKRLLRFIKNKLKTEPDQKVVKRDGKVLTLKEVFESLKLTSYALSIDTLDMHAHADSTFHRFDKFNLKYNPVGESRLREIFLKSNNLIEGRYYAEVCRQVFDDLEESRYQMAEYRVSVYGKSPTEFTNLGRWFVKHNMASDNVRWLIQVPRLFYIYRASGLLNNFNELLDNLFRPLFQVTADPSSDPDLATFLEHVVGFDSVDDESKPEVVQHAPSNPAPPEWTSENNPSYSYYVYYMYANLTILNKFRQSKGLNTFALRPHSGEAGSYTHLATTFLLAQNIAHGIQLRKAPVMNYLYYLCQIGLCVSPLSNNSLFVNYHKNPFPEFHSIGMNISLSTDDPLLFHFTREPLIEEYSIASQVWKLSAVDMAELCCSSVRMSGFPDVKKKSWLGANYQQPGADGNHIEKTNVPDIRAAYRFETLLEELNLLRDMKMHAIESVPASA
eukprot:m.357034 g.357034  ORF g.357034 m.357034 type:complete len:785 (+) comp17693_c0_seq1:155-2509(+)